MGVAAATRVVCLSALCLCVGVRGFYIPGVAPTEYEEGDKLEIKVRLTVSWDGLADGAGVMKWGVESSHQTMPMTFSYLPFLLVRVCFYIGRGEINKSHQNQEIALQLPLVACSVGLLSIQFRRCLLLHVG